MVRKAAECPVVVNEAMRGGPGFVEITHLATPEELYSKGSMFARVRLNPGCGIGFHVHEGNSELYFLLKGEAVYSDAGEEKVVTAGDVMLCPEGTGHGITNKSDEVVEFVALIVYA